MATRVLSAPNIPPSHASRFGDALERRKTAGSQLGSEAHVTAGDGCLEVQLDEEDPQVTELVQLLSRQPAPCPAAVKSREQIVHFPLKLNIVIHVVGSRGDVQPFIALGKALQRHGHRVRLATHLAFRDFVKDNGLEFFNIGGDPAELMAFMVNNPNLIPKMETLLHGIVGKRRQEIRTMIGGCWRSCIEAGEGIDMTSDAPLTARPFVADAIIANPPSFAHIHCAEKLGVPLHLMFTMPWSPTQAFPHPLANVHPRNTERSVANIVSYAITETVIWQGVGDLINQFRRFELGLEQLDAMLAPHLIHQLRIPFTYLWSPSFLPKPGDWQDHIDITGFSFLGGIEGYTPPPDLVEFLEAGPPPLYIGFGSIVVNDPDSLTKTILDAVEMSGQRALISKGWGGFGAKEINRSDVYFLGNVPHDWLFQRVSCVVHHGGAGTTAIGITLGRPTIIVPFFGDQPFWGTLVALSGAGPAPIPSKKLTAERLADAIRFCLKPSTIERACALSEHIRTEDGARAGVESFHRQLDLPRLQCSLCPDRPAVWRIKRTKIILSAFAATVLVQENKLDPKDVKLYRSKRYGVHHNARSFSIHAESVASAVSNFVVPLVDLPVNMVQNISQPAADRFAEKYNLPSCKVRVAAMRPPPAVAVTESTSPKVKEGEDTDSSGSLFSSETSNSQSDMPSMQIKRSEWHKIVANTTYAGRRITNWLVEVPLGITLLLSETFHNAPRWYHDRTVRDLPDVTGLKSGFVAAGRELGYGLYDGITGVVTQPRQGWKDHGFGEMAKGFGKGVGGLFLKPQAGLWGLIGYPLDGIHHSIEHSYGEKRKHYIVRSRIRQGLAESEAASKEEKAEVLAKWRILQQRTQYKAHA